MHGGFTVTKDEREWAYALRLDNALFAAQTISREEDGEFAVVDPRGAEVAWARNGKLVRLQGASRRG